MKNENGDPTIIEARGLQLPAQLHLLELGARFVRYEQDEDHLGGAYLEVAYYCPLSKPGQDGPDWDDPAYSEEVDDLDEAVALLGELTEEDVA